MYESVQQLGCGSPHHTFMRMAEIQDRHETDEQISIIKILVSVKLRTPSTSVKASNNDARVMKEKSNVPAQFLLVRRCFSTMSPREVVPYDWITLKELKSKKETLAMKIGVYLISATALHTYTFDQPQI